MNTPAKFRQKDLEKAIRAADKLGKAVIVQPDGSFLIVPLDQIKGKITMSARATIDDDRPGRVF